MVLFLLLAFFFFFFNWEGKLLISIENVGSTLFDLKSFVFNHRDLEDPGKEVSCFERNSTNLPRVTPAVPSMSQEDKHAARTFSRERGKKRTTVTKI